MRVLLLARPQRNRAGGLVWTANLLQEMFLLAGCDLDRRSIYQDLPPDLDPPDAVYAYGEFERLPGQLAAIHSLSPNAPVVVYSTIDGRKTRAQAMLRLLAGWRATHPRTFLGVFTAWAKDNLGTGAAVVVPQPFRASSLAATPGWNERSGICVGELRKLLNPRISGTDVPACVEALRRALPAVDLLAYDQHGGPARALEGVQTLPYMGGDTFLRFLSSVRICVSLAQYETFCMVPLEAQSVGTPVCYRPMPQSLDTYVGSSGLRFGSPAELAQHVKSLYNDRESWDAWSARGIANAEAHALAVQAPVMRAAFEALL